MKSGTFFGSGWFSIYTETLCQLRLLCNVGDLWVIIGEDTWEAYRGLFAHRDWRKSLKHITKVAFCSEIPTGASWIQTPVINAPYSTHYLDKTTDLRRTKSSLYGRFKSDVWTVEVKESVRKVIHYCSVVLLKPNIRKNAKEHEQIIDT
jgi:hypothetical protein